MTGRSRTHSHPDQLLLLITPPSDWEVPKELPRIPSGGIIAVDVEGKDEGLAQGRGPGWVYRAGYIIGFSVAWREHGTRHSVYVPVRHPDTENWDVGEAFRWLQDVIDRAARIVFHNRQFDEGWLSTEDVRLPPDRCDDTQAAAVLLDENWDDYTLDECCRRAGVPGKDEHGLREAAAAYGVDPKKDMWRLPARYVGPYAAQDAVATLDLWEEYWSQLVEQGLEEAYRLEMDLVPMALDMRRRGIRVDESAAERVQIKLRKQRDDVLDRLKTDLGIRGKLDMEWLNSGVKLSQLFDQVGLEYPRTPKTNVGSFKKDWLKSQAEKHWLPAAVMHARALTDMAEKFIGTYILDALHVGRVHAEIHLLRDGDNGTRSYRLSYSDPPLQQMPARDPDLAPLIRGILLPERDTLWGAADYSQQEPRLAVHLAKICRVAGAQDAVDYYLRDPGADFHQMVSELTGLTRSQAKIINLGLMYGMGLAKLARSLRVSIEEATDIIEQYHMRMPWVKELTNFCEARAQRRGYIRLLDGARCRFDHWEPAGRDSRDEGIRLRWDEAQAFEPWRGKRLRRFGTRKAMNRAVQGGSARQTKLAMRDCYREGILPLIQMHDELDFPIADPRVGERVKEIMINAVQLEVPMKVDLQYGHTWGQASEEPADKKTAPPSWEELVRFGPRVSSKEIIAARAA